MHCQVVCTPTILFTNTLMQNHLRRFLIIVLFSKFISTSDDGHMRAFCCGNAVTGECDQNKKIKLFLRNRWCGCVQTSRKKQIVAKHGLSCCQAALQDIVIFSNGARWNRHSVVNFFYPTKSSLGLSDLYWLHFAIQIPDGTFLRDTRARQNE